MLSRRIPGRHRCGAFSSGAGCQERHGKPEYEFNRRFAEEIIERAKVSSALQLVLLNPSAQRVGLVQRPQEAARRDVDLLLSIHHDLANKKYMRQWEHKGRVLEYTDAFSGFSLFVWDEGPYFKQSVAIATLIGKYLRSAGVPPTLHQSGADSGENRQLLSCEFVSECGAVCRSQACHDAGRAARSRCDR